MVPQCIGSELVVVSFVHSRDCDGSDDTGALCPYRKRSPCGRVERGIERPVRPVLALALVLDHGTIGAAATVPDDPGFAPRPNLVGGLSARKGAEEQLPVPQLDVDAD